MHLRALPLDGRFARLEPLEDAHREDLRAAADADAEIWPLYPYSMAGEHFDGYWTRVLAQQAQGSRLPLAVVVDGGCVGVSGFIAPDPLHATVEIGGTYLRPDVRGGPVNPQIKRLMLEHAFASGARRVAFQVDAANARSRAALQKLGAVQEGVLRRNWTTWTGRVRDTAVYAILASEWPAVRDGLDARLALRR